MENRTGRLDLLLLGIVERIASRDPVYAAVYRTFEPELRSLLKDLDSPRLRRAVRVLASGVRRTEPKRTGKNKLDAPRERTPASRPRGKAAKAEKPVEVTVKGADGKEQVVEAEWIQ